MRLKDFRAMAAPAIEIHGYVNCPFAWRVRIAAAEKGVVADWIPCDVDEPDARATAHNPDEHSPLFYEAGFTLLESDVIMQYLDESRPGRPLVAAEARTRATERLHAAQLKAIDVHTERSRPEAKRRSAPAFAALERALAARPDDAFLGGASDPGLVDILLFPFLVDTFARRLIPAEHARALAYAQRAIARASVRATHPPWAASLFSI